MDSTTIRVLIVEDDPLAAETLHELLSGMHPPRFSSLVAGSLSQALVLLQKSQFDVVLLDLGLPDSRGIDTASTVRIRYPGLPVVALTGLEDEETALKALRIDIQDYLIKGQMNMGLLTRSIRYAIERKRVSDALRESEEKFRAFFESAAVGTAQVDPEQGRFIQVNNRLCQMTGYDCKELLTLSFVAITHPDDRARAARLFRELVRGRSTEYTLEKRYLRKDGGVVWVQTAVTLVRTTGGKPVRAIVIAQDVTERKRAEEELRESEERMREAFLHAPVGMILTDIQGRYLYTNRAYQEIVGYSEQELRRPDFSFKRLTHPDDIEDNMQAMKRLLSGEIPAFFLEQRCIRKDGSIVWVRLSSSVRRDAEGLAFQLVGLVENIDERKRLEQEIRQMAQHDHLTGLANRRLFLEVAGIELAQARRYCRKIAIFFLDLDRFKEVNDSLGHDAGDTLLKETARRLKATIRTSDTAARIGGDEFNLLIPDIDHGEYAAEVAGKILNEVRKPFMIKGQELNLSTSIGISVYPDDSEEIDTLLRYADMAMYYAKEHGRNRYQFYNPVINTRSLERLNFETSFRRAIERGEFRLYFQPLIDIETRRIVAAELLLRWQHPERGLLLPGQFFRKAEESGFMPQIDAWVLEAAGSQITTWRNEGVGPVCVTVNVSAGQFQSPDLVGRVSRVLQETGMQPECLNIEITEATAMENIKTTIKRVRDLTNRGVQISIDNFGTGYSSVNYLKRLPIRKLKIDKSFVRDIATNSEDRAIVAAVLLMAHTMNMKVVAEGVEGVSQLDFLHAMHCDEAQGYLFSEPMPAERFKELIMTGRAA